MPKRESLSLGVVRNQNGFKNLLKWPELSFSRFTQPLVLDVQGLGCLDPGCPEPYLSSHMDACIHCMSVHLQQLRVPIFLDTLYRTHVHTNYLFLMKTTIQYSPDSAKLAQLTGFVSSQIWFYIVPVSFVIPGCEAQSLSF